MLLGDTLGLSELVSSSADLGCGHDSVMLFP